MLEKQETEKRLESLETKQLQSIRDILTTKNKTDFHWQ
jgi:hypothetical protein